MKIDIALLISLGAVLVIGYCLWLLFALKKDIPGGQVGRQWRLLEVLVWLFALGYLVTPFSELLSEQTLRLIVAIVFFFGALYVMVTVRLIHRIIRLLSG
ncbi:MAG: hypothetical protein HY942_07010 [Gammaproteobacteria bacterium]|nr:hypothetical protein [Gammaproteobacteria bacterium]